MKLDKGLEVEGMYWENIDRRVYTNGTIEYKVGGVVEEGTLVVGTLGKGGSVSLLPTPEGEEKVDISILRSLNINLQPSSEMNSE